MSIYVYPHDTLKADGVRRGDDGPIIFENETH